MTDRRGLVIALHWASAILLLAMVKGGSAAPGLRWAFVAIVAVWAGMAPDAGCGAVACSRPEMSSSTPAIQSLANRAWFCRAIDPSNRTTASTRGSSGSTCWIGPLVGSPAQAPAARSATRASNHQNDRENLLIDIIAWVASGSSAP